MFNLRFNQVFVGLLLISGFSAFVLPPRTTDRLRGVQKLFAPVSWPARKVGSALRDRFAPQLSTDHRAVADVKAENAELKTLVLNLSGQIEELKRISNEMEDLGDVRPMCTRFRVIGNDPSSTRESLSIPAASGDGVELRMPVIYSVGIVGRIDRVSAMGAQVQLITDPKFQAAARFFNKKHQLIQSTQPLVVGAGDGAMEIANIPLRETRGNGADDGEGIDVGDYVVLDDPDWPLILKQRILGQVESISTQGKTPTFALIRVKPIQNLQTLRNVMVMNRNTPDPAMKAAAEIKP